MPRSNPPAYRLSLTLLVLSSIAASSATAQIQVDRFFPPSVAIGETSEITAEGKFPSWPVTVVTDREDVKVTANEDSGKLSVVVSANAPQGLSWIRIHDESSVSSLVPLLIEPLPATNENEPNNEVQAANPISVPAIVVGKLHRRNEVDTFAVELKKDQTLIVATIANRLIKSPMDAVLQIVDQHGNVRLQNDDARGLDPQLVYHAKQDGRCFIRIFAFPETPNSTIGYAGDTSFVYQLRVTTGPYLNHVTPLLVNEKKRDSAQPAADDVLHPAGWNLPTDATPQIAFDPDRNAAVSYVPSAMGWQRHNIVSDDAQILRELPEGVARASRLPVIFAGQIDRPKEIDRLLIPVEKGKRYRVAVHSQNFNLGLDSVVRLVDPNNETQLATNDDTGRHEYDATVTYQAKTDGEIEIQVNDLVDAFGTQHAYTLLVGPVEPSIALTIDKDHLILSPEEEAELTIAINREDGFDSRLRITVSDLPTGVNADEVISEPQGESAKEVKLKLKADAKVTHQGPIHLTAEVIDEKGNPVGPKYPVRFKLSEMEAVDSIWLTVAKQKK